VPFVAYRDGKPVGRIAAVVNRAHNEYYKDSLGFFGFFDFIDDEEVARALIEAAKTELKKHGLTGIRGPYNPTSNDEMGLLVEGFDSIPFVMMPYNPAYYQKMYEKLGLQPIRDLLAFHISADVHPPERVKKIVERVKRSTGLTVRNINMKDLPNELKIIRDLYNVTLDRNWGFVPITLEDLEFAANDLKAIVDPSMVLIAEKKGVPAGFSMTIPNVNELMWKTKGSSTLMRILKFVWYLKTSHPKQARLAILGVKPEFRNSGISALFYYETLVRGKNKYTGGELSWVEDNNQEIIKGISVMGGKAYKSYRIYETPLNA
jgi:hypothetical protein